MPARARVLLLVALVVAATWARSLGCDFVYDDRIVVLDNADVRSLAAWPRWFAGHFWSGAGRELGRTWRPAVLASYAVDHALWGLDPHGFHLSSALAWTGAALAVAELALALGLVPAAAALAGALAGVHPLAAEAAVGIAFRGDALALLLGALALALHARGRALGAALALALGLLSKETAISVLPALVGLDLLRGRRRPRAWAAFGLVSAAWFAARWAAVGAPAAAAVGYLDNPAAFEPWPRRALLALDVLARQAGHLVLPARLSVDYGLAVLPLEPGPGALAGGLLLALWAASPLLLARRAPAAALGLGWSLAAYLVTSNLLVPADQMMADRFMTVPLAGLALAAADGLARLRPRALAAALGGAAVVALAARSVARVDDWRTTAALMEAAVRATPRSARAWYGVASEALDAGRVAEAAAAYDRAVALAPAYVAAWSDRALALVELGRADEAVESARTAVALAPDDPLARNNLGVALTRAGRLAEAERAFAEALALDPSFERARSNLAAVRAERAAGGR